MLVSPGVEVNVIDESFYASAGNGTVPLIIMATAQDKIDPSGTNVAAGTTKENAGRLQLFTSQRELLQTMGSPTFHKLGGSSLHGYELNEYGLLAAHSYLGVANRVYGIRAAIDLAELQPLDMPPVGVPVGGTYWLDTNSSKIGIKVYDGAEWKTEKVSFLDDVSALTADGAPESYVAGNIGDFKVVSGFVSSTSHGRPENRIFRRTVVGWEMVKNAIYRNHTKPPYANELANPVVSAVTGTGYMVGERVTFAGSTGSRVVADVTAVDVTGAVLSVDIISYGIGFTTATTVTQVASTGAGTGLELTGDVISAGDIWIKTSKPNGGSSFALKYYDAEYSQWVSVDTPIYANTDSAVDNANHMCAIYNHSISTPSVGAYNSTSPTDPYVSTGEFAILRHNGRSVVEIESKISATPVAGDALIINGISVVATSSLLDDLVSAITVTAIPGIFASIQDARLHIRNDSGKELTITGTGTMMTDMLFAGETRAIANGSVFSNWEYLSYESKASEAPFRTPTDGRLWYSNEFKVDLLINSGTGTWEEMNSSVFVQPSRPLVAVPKDIWIDTDQIEEYPVIYRYSSTNTWDKLDTNDQTTPNGVIFGDARTASSNDTATGLYNGGFVGTPDLDADRPDPLLYPRDMILWNTRESSHVVKEWHGDYVFEGVSVGGRWVLASGYDFEGPAKFGRHAVKQMIVDSMAEAIQSNEAVRNDSINSNLMAAPGFPELTDDLVTLNYDKKLTSFILQDAPMRLAPNGADLENYAMNKANSASNDDKGLVTHSTYAGIFYPGAALSTNVDGEEVVVPATHAVLRTYALNDQIAYPWFAAAFSRRGVVTNASTVGYLDAEGEYVPTELNEGLRDVLYANKMNPIHFIPGSGLEIYGQKSLHNASSSRDRINVVRLENYIRERCPAIARPFLGEQNDKLTRSQVQDVFERFLDHLITLRAIEDYSVICSEENNTPARRDRNELYIDIVVIPLKTVEFIYIPVRFRNSGADLSI